MRSVSLASATPSATRKLGERIGRRLRAGDVVLLSGDLGAGKTVLAQGIGRGLGVIDPIKSSSFVIMNEYDGAQLRLYHADLYRLEDPAQVAELALDELAATWRARRRMAGARDGGDAEGVPACSPRLRSTPSRPSGRCRTARATLRCPDREAVVRDDQPFGYWMCTTDTPCAQSSSSR